MDWLLIGQLMFLIIGPISGVLSSIFITRRLLHREYGVWALLAGLMPIALLLVVGHVYLAVYHHLEVVEEGYFYHGEFFFIVFIAWWVSVLIGVVLYILISMIVVNKARLRFRQNLWNWPKNLHRWLIGISISLVILWATYYLFHQARRIKIAEQLSQVTSPFRDAHLRNLGSILLPGQFSLFGEPNYVIRGGINISPDGRWMSLIMTRENVEFRRMSDLRICGRVKKINKRDPQVAFSPDTTKVAIWSARELSIYQLGECELRLESRSYEYMRATNDDVIDMVFNSEGSTLIFASAFRVFSINLINEDLSDDYMVIPPGNNYPKALSWDGNFLATINESRWGYKPNDPSELGTIRVYNLSTNQIVNTFVMRGNGGSYRPGKVEFLSNGDLFFWEEDHGSDFKASQYFPVWDLHIADISSGQIKSTVVDPESQHDYYQSSSTISPDGHLFVLGRPGSLSVWDLESNDPGTRIPISYEPTAVQFSPDRRILVVATFDGRLHFFSQVPAQ